MSVNRDYSKPVKTYSSSNVASHVVNIVVAIAFSTVFAISILGGIG